MRILVLALSCLALAAPAMAQGAQRNVIAGTVVARATGAVVPGVVVSTQLALFESVLLRGLPAYTLMDAAATYRRGPLRFTLSAHNLFNNEYCSEGDLELASPGAPRQILFTTSASFR